MKRSMKALPFSLVLLFGAVVGPVVFSPMAEAQATSYKKGAIRGRILQVLPEGFLMGGSRPYLLIRHPEHKKLADGDEVNCDAYETDKTFKYTDLDGAERTVRIWVYKNERIGK